MIDSETNLGNSLLNTQIKFIKGLIEATTSSFYKEIDPIGEMTSQESFAIYQRSYKARLIEVLGETFEACWWVLGDDLFFKIAELYINKFPSQIYDLDQYGDLFPKFLADVAIEWSLDQEIDFLSDLAYFEWQFKSIFHKKNPSEKSVDLSSIISGSIKQNIMLLDSIKLYKSKKNVYEVWKLRKSPQCALSEINIYQPLKAVIYKMNSQVYVRILSNLEYFTLDFIEKNRNLNHLFESIIFNFPSINENEVSALFSFLNSLPLLSLQKEISHE